MPTITLSDDDFNNLKAISEPFVDHTPEIRISRLIVDEMKRMSVTPKGNSRHRLQTETLSQFSPDTHDDLTFTKVLSATIDGREMHRPKWNSFMNHVHVLGLKLLGSFDALEKATGARIRQGRYEEEGYRYLPDGDFSIQGVDANSAWNHSLSVARAVSMAIKVTFRWREDGVHPGQNSLLEWIPSQTVYTVGNSSIIERIYAFVAAVSKKNGTVAGSVNRAIIPLLEYERPLESASQEDLLSLGGIDEYTVQFIQRVIGGEDIESVVADVEKSVKVDRKSIHQRSQSQSDDSGEYNGSWDNAVRTLEDG